MKIALGPAEIIGKTDTGLEVGAGTKRWRVDRVLIATGRRPVLQGLNLEHLNLDLDAKGMPVFDRETLQVGNLPVFLAGDVNGLKPILHEAADDGTIAGYNACAGTVARFKNAYRSRSPFLHRTSPLLGCPTRP